MKSLFYISILPLVFFASSCNKKANKEIKKPFISGGINLDTLVGEINLNITITKNTYLHGLVYVKPGVTLTIEPGVTVFGSENTNIGVFDAINSYKNKGTLCVEKGAKLIAQGTCSSPIIWTCDNKILVGNRKSGDWGGIVLYGNAPIYKGNLNVGKRLETFDIIPNDNRNFYGGRNTNDNSGVMTYNRIEFAGGAVAELNKEVSGLTLCGVGSTTTINHVEVLKSGDDGFKFLGGNVNAHHLFSYATKDDDFDFNEGYTGKLQFIVAIRDTSADNSGSHLLEMDNDLSSSNYFSVTSPFIANATLVGPIIAKNFEANPSSYFDGAIQVKGRASVTLVNSYVIANAMRYGLIFSPTTFIEDKFPTQFTTSYKSKTGSFQAYNIYQINNPGFSGIVVQLSDERNQTPAGLINSTSMIEKLSAKENANNSLISQGAFKLGLYLENKTISPFFNTGKNLATIGLPFFVGTQERGGVITTDNWILEGIGCAWVSLATK